MPSTDQASPSRAEGWLKFAALVLVVAAVGIPLNQLTAYVLVLIAAVIIFTGTISFNRVTWSVAAVVVALSILGQHLLAPPKIEEGHNVFLPGGSGVLQSGLPPDVYAFMAAKFEARYPEAKRCAPNATNCTRAGGFPDRTFAFSSDGIFARPAFSRSVASFNFSDPVRLRLGFVNDIRYNWFSADMERGRADRRFWMGWHRWHLTMPWFVMIQPPSAFAGGELCWHGDILWERADNRFDALTGPACRVIQHADAGKRIFGVAIDPDTLSMNLSPPLLVRLQQATVDMLGLIGVFAVVMGCVRWRVRWTGVPFLLIGLALAVIAIDDGSFIGGMRPLDGGDDGLFYDSLGRTILQRFLAGDISGALQGGEDVFYYGGPGLRYFRAVEHFFFGESYLGYLSLVLVWPIIVHMLARRFLPPLWALAVAVGFVAIPVGAIFGTSFFHYAKWAARGFADPAAYVLFVAGLIPILGTGGGPQRDRFASAFFGALLLALGVFMKPIVAPAAAIFIGGAGLAALYLKQWKRIAGLCMGFSFVFSMALHNWVYGRAFVLFSSNSGDANLLVMPPAAYLGVLRELMSLDFGGGFTGRALTQFANWLSLPAESYLTIPLNAAAVAVLVYVVARGHAFDPWLRLVGAAALGQHVAAFFYNAAAARYHFLTWFLTALVVAVWLHAIGVPWLCARYPRFCQWIEEQPGSRWLASGLARLHKMSS